MLLFALSQSIADVMLSVIIMWIQCGCFKFPLTGNSRFITAYLPSGEDLPYFEGANTGAAIPCFGCMDACLWQSRITCNPFLTGPWLELYLQLGHSRRPG